MDSLDKVKLLADDRLDPLRGQSMTVGNTLVYVPEDGPVEVDASTAAILAAQPGWRYAPASVRPVKLPSAAGGQSSKTDLDLASTPTWAQQKHGRRQHKSTKGSLVKGRFV